MILWLIALPGAAGAVSFWLPWERARRGLLILAAGLHLFMTGACWVIPPAPRLGGWLVLDGIGLLFLTIISVLFLASAIYSAGYLRREQASPSREESDGGNAPEARFIACLLAFQATMTLVVTSHHFGLFWVAMEATTLASAPLIYFHRHTLSLEAVWKYLMICSVGIALALLGNFCLVVAATTSRGEPVSLVLGDLIQPGRSYQIVWLKAAFIFILVGYGTKMGLAPLHTWLPDAHSESPSLVSSLLSGALLNCAFLGILRAQQVGAAAGIASFGQDLLVGFGLLSIAIAAVFIIGQNDYKRLLAYSSIEHMGILALGVGLGGVGIFGTLLHAVNHSFTKGMLFLVAGNILAAYRTKSVARVQGVTRVLPVSGVLWIMGFLAITGTPPFGPFLSEFTILKAAIDQGRPAVAAAYLIFLSVIFMGMAATFLRT
ncbi:MAG TPA: proton-conducting transporter membrane subunit, partial [bacterium]|nr:proton-conducting transporter membrane subunit [bacterium]